MARPKTFTEMEEAVEFFPEGSHKLVARLIARATKKEMAANKRAVKAAVGGSRGAQRLGQAVSRHMAKQLTKALRQRGASKRQAPSIKQKAPDSGGRPFHFAHSAVSKTPKVPSGSSSDPGTQKGVGPSGGGAGKASTKSAAHMRYIERKCAVEHGREAPDVQDIGGIDPLAQAPAEKEGGGRERTRAGDDLEVVATSSRSGQGYIENPLKLDNGEHVVFSFGTIGDRFEERVAFWESLEEHERNENGRVQDRLIVELPHEASPEARHDMVRAFTRHFEEKNLPYWAALHAPGEDNDSRNYHAHIVYSTRPAKRMVDPSDGVEKWDFATYETYKTASRNVRTRYPHRQKRDPDMERSDAIRKMRAHFATVVNEVLVRDDVKAKDGTPVRYDARSYKAMGLDVVPMRSINRIVADKMKSGKLTVLDGDYTRKMIEAELREARGRRDKRLSELDKLGQAINRLGREPTAKGRGRDLPRNMRPALLAKLGTKVVTTIGQQVLKARYAAYVHDVMEQSSRSTIDRIVEATDPKVLAKSHAGTKDPVRRDALPDLALAAALHREALVMREAFERDNARERERLRIRVGQALNKWTKAVATPTPEPMRANRQRRLMSLEEAAVALRTEPEQTRPAQQQAQPQPDVAPSGRAPRGAPGGRSTTALGDPATPRGEPATARAAPKGDGTHPARTPAGSPAPAPASVVAPDSRPVAPTDRPAAPVRDASAQVSAPAGAVPSTATGPATAPSSPPSKDGGAGSHKEEGAAPVARGGEATPAARGPIPPGRKATPKEKAELRQIFEENAKRIMQAMRKLRDIADVDERMAAMDAFAKAPLGPMDEKSKAVLEDAWSRVPESRFAGRPLPTGNAPFPTARQDVVTAIVAAGGSGTGDGRMSATPTADPIGLATGAAPVRAGLTERERIGSGTPTALVELVSPEATDNGATEPPIPEASHILTPEEELVAQRKAKAERDRKRRKALLSRGKGKGGRER